MMEGMLIVTKQDRKPSHTRAMRSRLIAAAVSVATVLGLAVTGTAIAANVGTVAPEAAQSATTQASQAGTGPISGVAQGDSAQQGASSALTDRAGTGASGQTATVKASAAPRATANDGKVKINLFDYWDSRDPNGPAKAAGKENVNYATGGTSRNESAAAFYFNGKGKDWNGWTGSAETSPGIVKTNLTKTGADAVPQFSTMVTNKNNAQTDMTYLFTESEWAKAYTNGGNGLTGLFDPTEEAKGHYVYDSNTTYAALNSVGTGFDRSATWTERTDAWIPKFLPFNADKSQLRIGFHSVRGARYAFGMTAYAKFMQPKEGKLVDGSPMTFNAYVNYEGTDSDKDYTLYTGKYDVYNTATGTKDGETRTTDSNGVITLKAGQYAVLLGSDAKRITESSKYKVTEINVDQDTYAVSANGGQVKVTQEKDSATTEPVSVGEVPRTTVTNTVVTAPRYRKYIKANNDGTYDLSLNVTGTQSGSSQTTVSPADIVVVFDTSGSMSNPMGDNSRLEVAKTAVNSMAQHLLTSENQGKDSNIRMALVPFSTTAGNVSNFTGNAMDIVSAVNGLGADGGTNWEAALKAANAKLTSGRKGVKKYIVFMSDGDPTFRTSSVRTGTDWWGRPTYDDDDRSGLPAGVHGSGSSDRYGANLSSAVAEANRRGDTTLFSVGVSSDPTKMRGFADQTKGSYYSATSTDELNKAFADIIGQINRKSSYKNVSITDTLSDYAEFVNANFGSNDVTVTASKDGNSVDLNESDYTVTVSGKTVKVTFADGYELQDGVTYTVTFKVKPTQKAYNEYAANKQNDDKTGYKDVLGADNTDADGHHTSSNLPGFHSNADHGAKLEYTVVNTVGDQTTETPGSVEYPHPVLQVKTGKIQVTKNWSDGAEKHGNGSVTVTLKQCNAQGEDCKDINRAVTLNNQGQWAGAFENLAPGTYRVEESRVDGYTASYNPENQLVTVTADDLWAAPDNNNMTTFDNVKTYPVTITNTFVAVSALPMTGGATTRDWLVYGGGFGLLAALVRIGYFIWRKRRLV